MRLLNENKRNKISAGPNGLQVITSGDMSAASVTSDSFTVQHTPIVCIELNWAGAAPVGTAQLQGSVSGLNWFNVGSTVAVSGASGTVQVTDANAGYLFARVVYTRTSGSGTLQAYSEAKGF